jgi:hypothetical protein
MFTPHPLDALVLAHEHGRSLRAQAAAERLVGAWTMRGAIAVWLRRAADRVDPGALVRQPAR